MTLWQGIDFAGLLDRESSGTVTPLQVFESIDGNSRCARGKLQEPALLLGIPRSDGLPEVLDDFILLLITAIVCMFLPVIDINICNAADEELQFSFVKHIHQIWGDQLVETGDEGVELFLNTLHDLPFGDEPEIGQSVSVRGSVTDQGERGGEISLLDIFPFVLIGDLNIASIGFEVDGLGLAKLLIFD